MSNLSKAHTNKNQAFIVPYFGLLPITLEGKYFLYALETV